MDPTNPSPTPPPEPLRPQVRPNRRTSATDTQHLPDWAQGLGIDLDPVELEPPSALDAPPVRTRRAKVRTEDETRRTTRSSNSLPVSSFVGDHEVDLDQDRTGWWVWLGTGVGAALLAQGAAWYFFHGTDTFGGALMFAIAVLAGMIYPLFQRNAKEIWSRRRTPGQANLLLVADLLCLFMGLITGFLLLPLVMGTTAYAEVFSGIARFVDVRRASLARFDFADVGHILLVNLRVMLVFFLIGLLFRYVGTLLVVVWNAATWGVVFAASLAGTLWGTRQGSGWEGAQLALVVLPHLIVETAAYLFAATAGIFLSRACQRYRLTSDRFEQVGRTVLMLLTTALVLVVAAALLEGIWGCWLARLWFRQWEIID